jgi:benzoyl-CoA 2,3-dioxygenase component B
VGTYSQHHVSPEGQVLTDEEWASVRDGYLPADQDRADVAALMVPEYEYGKFAGWIAPPLAGINDQPVEFDYVHLAEEGLV